MINDFERGGSSRNSDADWKFDNPDWRNGRPTPRSERVFKAGEFILGRYRVLDHLGEGGMGIVYRCLDTVGDVEVAVKGLPSDVAHSSSEMEEVRKNYRIVQGLVHDNIAVLKTLERDDLGDYFVVMELVRGVNLKTWAERYSGLEKIEEKIAILRQIANALDYAHSAKPRYVIHRDIKPENIMVDETGHVKVLDFGLAAQVQTSMSHVSMMVTSRSGTAVYKSPEQWMAQVQKAAADQYSLGVVAYYLFAGNPPFDSDDVGILKYAVIHDTPPEIYGIQKGIQRALRKALAKKPQDRFENCARFVDALEGKVSFKLSDEGHGKLRNHLVVATAIAIASCCFFAYHFGIFSNTTNADLDKSVAATTSVVGNHSADGKIVAQKLSSRKDTAIVPVDMAAIKAEAFSLAANAERAHTMIEAESDATKKAFASEIRQFEQDRRAGLDARDGTHPDYSLAVSFFEKALGRAKDLKEKVDNRNRVQELQRTWIVQAGALKSRLENIKRDLHSWNADDIQSNELQRAGNLYSQALKMLDSGAASNAVVVLTAAEAIYNRISRNATEKRILGLIKRMESCAADLDEDGAVLNANDILKSDPGNARAKNCLRKFEEDTIKDDQDFKRRIDFILAHRADKNESELLESCKRLRTFEYSDFKIYPSIGFDVGKFDLIHDVIRVQNGVALIRFLVESKRLPIDKANGFGKDCALHVAVKCGRLRIAEYLLRRGAEINAVNGKNLIPFDFVKSIDFARLLQTAGSTIRLPPHSGFQDMEILNFLRTRGVDVPVPVFCETAAKNGDVGYLRSHLAEARSCPLLALSAASGGSAEVIDWVLEQNFDLHGKSTNGWSILHHAASSKKISLTDFRKLFDKAALNVNDVTTDGVTPLHVVCNASVAKYLLEKGSDVAAKNKHGQTPLASHAGSGNLSVLRILVEAGAEVDVSDKSGYTPLDFAVICGNCENAKYLLQKGANPNHVAMSGWKVALGQAVWNGDCRMARLLIGYNAEVNFLNPDNPLNTPLFQACFNGDVGMAELLLEAGANMNMLVKGVSPMRYAILGCSNGGSFKIVKFLVAKGFKVDSEFVKGVTNLPLKMFLDEQVKMSNVRKIGRAQPQTSCNADSTIKAAFAAFEKKDWKRGYELSKKTDCSNPIIQYYLGVCYMNGNAVSKDIKESAHWFRKSAEQGYADAQNSLGAAYVDGRGVAQDYSEAAKWYRKAAEQGEKFAQYNLARLYQNGNGVEKDDVEAAKWYRKSAEQGNADAQNSLGAAYVDGRGVAQDYSEAAKWYRKAAEQGEKFAQCNLARLYQNGNGVEKDDAEAVKWYRKAAEQGHAGAQNSLGFMYDHGYGVDVSVVDAAECFRKAAAQGHVMAQVNLAIMFEMGRGVEKNEDEAIKWYRKAAKQGSSDAIDALKERGISGNEQSVDGVVRHCGKCGAKARANQKFCGKCGNRLQ